MAGKPADPNKPKVARKIGPTFLYIELDETKLVEGAKPLEVVKAVLRNPNTIFDRMMQGEKVTVAKIEVKKQSRKPAA